MNINNNIKIISHNKSKISKVPVGGSKILPKAGLPISAKTPPYAEPPQVKLMKGGTTTGWLLLITSIIGIVTVTGFAGKLWWIFDLTSHFHVQYCVLLIIIAGIALLLRHFKILAISLLFAAINFYLVIPFYLKIPSSSAQSPTLRVLLLNVNYKNQQSDKILDLIKSIQPDLIFLAEINYTLVKKIELLRGIYPYSIIHPRENSFGIALLSKTPLKNARIKYIGEANLPSAIANFKLNEETITLIGTHTHPPIGNVRSYYRNQHLEELGAFIASLDNPTILIGDLNITSWSRYFQSLLKQSKLQDSQYGFGIQPSWPSIFPFLGIAIDHCLITKEIIVHNRTIGPRVGSDHLPVIIDISLRKSN